MSIQLTLVRHTKVHNPNKICYGHFDIELFETFEAEAEIVKSSLALNSYDIVYSSPLSRCAKLANYCFPNSEIIYDPLLKELDFGIWEGKTWKEVENQTRSFFDNYSYKDACPEGESFFDLLMRLQSFLEMLEDNVSNGKKVIVFTHGGPVRAVISILHKISPLDTFNQQIQYGEINHFTLKNNINYD